MSPTKFIIRDAHFSKCGLYRYRLDRIWDTTLPMAMLIGLNPSTANESDDDRTISRIIKLMEYNGYGGFYMTNLFALISSNPDDLRSCPDPLKDNDIWLNDTRKRVNDVIFCWGAFKQAKYRTKAIIIRFPSALCFKKTKDGSPWHPLYLRGETKLQPFR